MWKKDQSCAKAPIFDEADIFDGAKESDRKKSLTTFEKETSFLDEFGQRLGYELWQTWPQEQYMQQKQMPYLIRTNFSSKLFVFILISVKNLFYSDHNAKYTSSQTESEQAKKAIQLLICTRSPAK